MPGVRSIIPGSVSSDTTPSTTQATIDFGGYPGSNNDNQYKDRMLVFTSGDLQGMALKITNFVGSSGLITYSATPNGLTPSSGDDCIVV